MKLVKSTRSGFTLVELLVVIAIIVALAALATPAILKSRKKADMVQAVNNSKQIYTVFLSFEDEYGSLPDDETREADDDIRQTPAGQDSNSYLSQLIFSGEIQSEQIFFAKGGAAGKSKKPDDVFGFNNAEKTLEEGECGFAYVLIQDTGGGAQAGERGQSFSDNPGRIVLATPMDTEDTFRPDPFDGKAVLLKLDGSAVTEKVSRSTSRVNAGNGDGIFDTGDDSVWGTTAEPQIQLPQ